MTLDVVKTKIGDINITQIIELEIGETIQHFISQATPEEIKKIKWLDYPYINEDGTLNGVSQAFIIEKNDRLIVVDTCIGNDKKRIDFPHWNELHLDFLSTLEENSIDRYKVTDVLCTHLHLDHVGWNTMKTSEGWLPTFPNAKYHFGHKEYEFWTSEEGIGSIGEGQEEAVKDSVLPILDAGLVNFLDENADLGDGIKVISTPGHTPGHNSVIFETGAKDFIITGDCIHHPCQFANLHWSMKADNNAEVGVKTRREFADKFSNEKYIVAGTHFSAPSIGNLIKKGENFEFHPIDKE
ncbi:MBL fold metallo-hydrolase [Floricoccus penangensis]|uniref:MBL fold metallo-hydrolase n=1 Tax=Floricoccus penangensis TaxID=1859475 RepID=UPI00203D60C6|nr:MBL fold metallo-hydrolase [Floricoccus penangensis]URZ87890.1 MBL fold metallo-hydrolase [Floricoccus penangensis]